MSDTKFVIKKKEYNANNDSGAGVLVFDKNTKTIILGGESFSSNIKSGTWNPTTKVLTLTMVDGTVYTINLVDDTSGNVPTSLLCGLRDDVNANTNAIGVLNGNTANSVSGQINTAIGNLDASLTMAADTNDVVTIKQTLTETDGVVSNSSSPSITLAKVAKTGVATDVNATVTETNPGTGQQTQVTKPVQTVLDDIIAQIVTISSNTFKYVIPTSNATCPSGFYHYYSSNQRYTGSLQASANTVSNIYLCKNDSYSGSYHQIVTIVNGNNYSWADVSDSGISLDGYVKTLTINGQSYAVSSNTTNITIGDIINAITAETAISGGNSDYVSVSSTDTTVNGVKTTALSSNVKVVGVSTATANNNGLATAKDVQDYVKDNLVTFRTWANSDIPNNNS